MPKYRRAGRHEIPADKRRIAETTARDAARKLGLPLPTIVWRVQTAGAGVDVAGSPGAWVNWRASGYDGEINIVADMPAELLAAVVQHEARHLWQRKNVRYYGDTRKAEADADRWAYRQTGVLLPPECLRRIKL